VDLDVGARSKPTGKWIKPAHRRATGVENKDEQNILTGRGVG